jgi:hypothetical protein
MENMSTILMDINALDVLTIDVSAQMIALVDDQATLTLTVRHTGKSSTIDTCSDNQIVILFIHYSLIFLQK